MDLNRRERTILNRIVEQYIASGEPVASRQVARSARVRLSPATVRNVMAGLESAGFLNRPHASAGSVPTDSAFRSYVDSLAPGRVLPVKTRKNLTERMAALRRELAEDLGWVATLVADATHEAGVAVRPMGERCELEIVSLLPIGDRRVLGVVVTTDGSLEKRVLVLEEDVSREELLRVANTLNHLFHGRSMDSIGWHPVVAQPEVGNDQPAACAEEGVDDLVRCFARRLFSSSSEGTEVLVAGSENLLSSSDFSQVDRLRSVMGLLQDRERIVREWRRLFVGEGTQIVIGRESEVTATGNLGMVATLFFREGKRVGAVGVVGPRRMDYLRIVPVVEFVGNTLTSMLDEHA